MNQVVGGVRCKVHGGLAEVTRKGEEFIAGCSSGHTWVLTNWLPGPLPSFFRALCAEAMLGGSRSYAAAGHELMRHAEELVGDDEEMQETLETEGSLGTLETVAGIGTDEALLEWLRRYLPRCVHLVPTRRLGSFLQGCWKAIGDENVL